MIEQALFYLIRVGLRVDALNGGFVFPELDERGWEALKALSEKQAVSGIVLDGLNQTINDKGKNKIAGRTDAEWWTLFITTWIGETAVIRQQNLLLNQRTVEVARLFDKAGIRNCILKGQGNAMYYPESQSRMPGDIDIWVDMGREETMAFVRRLCPEAKGCEHHIDMPIFADATVEVHFKPRYLFSPKHNRAFDQYVERHRDEQFEHLVKLDGQDKICVPTAEFNLVYLLTHMMGHFVEDGIGLRQMTDYYMLLRTIHKEESTVKDYGEAVRAMGMERFARGLMWIGKEKIGLPEDSMMLEGDEQYGKIILKDVMETGNLGQYGEFLQSRERIPYAKRSLMYLKRQASIWPVVGVESPWHLWGVLKDKVGGQ